MTADKQYAFWQSEKNGYAHLYRFTLAEGKTEMEKGVDLFDKTAEALIVQKLIRVDEENQLIYFMADHVACAAELKENFPFMDMERVGMWGNSGGGYATVSALFQYPEFDKVGVASLSIW